MLNSRVLKVGRNIELDLRQLQEESKSPIPFPGGIDLARLAKEKGVISDARIGLADLCARVTKTRLEKDSTIRISPNWSMDVLTEDQKRYAALDVWASLLVYEELQKLRVPEPLFSFSGGEEVFLYHDDRTSIIARGWIAHSIPDSCDNIRITPSKTLIFVTKVFVPAALISQHGNRTLSSFGATPFNLICLRSRLKTYVADFDPRDVAEPLSTTSFPAVTSNQISTSADVSSATSSIPDTSLALSSIPTGAASSTLPLTAESDLDCEPGTSLQDLEGLIIDFSDAIASDPSTNPPASGANIDSDGQKRCAEILEELRTQPWPEEIRSGVLKDIFHVFQMLYIARAHGLRVTFAQTLRDAIFLPDAEDKRRLVSYLSRLTPPMTWDECLRSKPSLIKRHCKHVVPPPEVLYNVVAKVFSTYGPLRDAQTHLPLFNAAAWKTAKNILSLIRAGYISDPPGIPLYTCLGTSSTTGLPIYRCFCGTNFTEGAVHRPIRHSLPINGASPRHTSTRIVDYVYHHNMNVSSL